MVLPVVIHCTQCDTPCHWQLLHVPPTVPSQRTAIQLNAVLHSHVKAKRRPLSRGETLRRVRPSSRPPPFQRQASTLSSSSRHTIRVGLVETRKPRRKAQRKAVGLTVGSGAATQASSVASPARLTHDTPASPATPATPHSFRSTAGSTAWSVANAGNGVAGAMAKADSLLVRHESVNSTRSSGSARTTPRSSRGDIQVVQMGRNIVQAMEYAQDSWDLELTEVRAWVGRTGGAPICLHYCLVACLHSPGQAHQTQPYKEPGAGCHHRHWFAHAVNEQQVQRRHLGAAGAPAATRMWKTQTPP